MEQQARIAKLTTSKAELEDQLRLQTELAREEKVRESLTVNSALSSFLKSENILSDLSEKT